MTKADIVANISEKTGNGKGRRTSYYRIFYG